VCTIAFLFPGQGAQSVGMGQDFYQKFPVAKEIFDDADQILGFSLTKIMFEGPLELLTETRHSQLALFVTSAAILAVLKEQYPKITPQACAGLSLGEYTALYASGRLTFKETLLLIDQRAAFMQEACLQTEGAMSAVLGLKEQEVTEVIDSMPDVWLANLNAPGQIVISGNKEAVARCKEPLMNKGARKVIPLKVHGAFHSGLMVDAEKKLSAIIANLSLPSSNIALYMNLTGRLAKEEEIIPNLQKQMTNGVRWVTTIESMDQNGIDIFIEVGTGTTIAGLNRKITSKPTLSIGTVKLLEEIAKRIDDETLACR
jgi:[acyl-carrier-protein] S-malonyltransferase